MASLVVNLITPTTTTATGEPGTFVRISKDISDGEKKSIAARKKVVIQWYARQGITVDPANVPVVALMLAGGGLTATLSCIAILDELKNQDLLDAAIYTFGCSGSTWTLTSLNDAENWSENLSTLKNQLADQIAGLPLAIAPGLLKIIAAAEREDYSLTDFWAYLFIPACVKELNERIMSSWRATQESGTVPYVVNATAEKVILEATDFKTAGYNFEHTVHESGFSDQGVFVDTTRFESKFDNNKLIKKEPEPNLTFMQGMWGSACGSIKEVKTIVLDMMVRMLKDPLSNLVVPLLETLSLPGGLFPGNDPISKVSQILSQLKGILSLGGDQQKAALADMSSALSDKPDSVSKGWIDMMRADWDTSSATDKANMVQILPSILAVELNGPDTPILYNLNFTPAFEGRPFTTWRKGGCNVLQDLFNEDSFKSFSDCKSKFGLSESLVANIGKALLKTAKALVTWEWGTTNNFAHGLTSFSNPLKDRPKIYLADSGLGMNIPFPQAQRPQRNVQLYIACDFFPLDPFRSATKASEYSAANNIPFPTVTIPAGEEFNPSKDCYIYEEPNKPTLMYIPLFNKVNTKGLMKVDTAEFILFRSQFTRGEIDVLMGLSASNIRNNASQICEQIKKLATK